MRGAFVFLALAVAASGCSSSPSGPSTTDPIFVATLLPANEVPPVTNADSSNHGNAQITLLLQKDATGALTGANATFDVVLTNFPPNTPLVGAHIHRAPVGVNGPIVVSTLLAAGEVTLVDGSGSFTKSSISVPVATVQDLMANPSGFYFNVHTALNPGGASRGQLSRLQ
jgi:hypothetical protein